MIIYRDLQRTVDARAWLRDSAASVRHQLSLPQPDHAIAVRLLVEFGEIEAALCDRLMPQSDDDTPETRALRKVAVGIAHLLRCAWRHLPAPGGHLNARNLLALIEAVHIPSAPLRVNIPEGFAHYGLYPETYLEAAERFARATPQGTAICIGLRSIGTALSAVVTAALQAAGWRVTTITLRPRGKPFARHPQLARSLLHQLRPESYDYALIVDEGPGLSGSSLCGTAEALSTLGFTDERIVFFPSWNPDAAQLGSVEARTRWPRHPRFVGNFEHAWIESGRLCDIPLLAQEAGRWRSLHFEQADYPPVHPHHERRKFLTLEAAPRLLKFAGIGPYGEAALQRAEAVAQAGYGPPVLDLRHGFLVSHYVPGRPLRSGDLSTPLIENAARYFAWRQRTFPAQTHTAGDTLRHMTFTNIAETFGTEFDDIVPMLNADAFEEGVAVEVDGRVQPWEWISTSQGVVKTDAVDHHADHFYPGDTDIAWDLAGFISEFELNEDGIALLLRRFVLHSGDTRIHKRLPRFRLAYGAFRLGYAQMAAQTLVERDEADRFRRRSEIYRTQLRHLLTAMRTVRAMP